VTNNRAKVQGSDLYYFLHEILQSAQSLPCYALLLAKSLILFIYTRTLLEQQNSGCEGEMNCSPSSAGKGGKEISAECEGLTSNCEVGGVSHDGTLIYASLLCRLSRNY
jgi:hypothetical protein